MADTPRTFTAEELTNYADRLKTFHAHRPLSEIDKVFGAVMVDVARQAAHHARVIASLRICLDANQFDDHHGSWCLAELDRLLSPVTGEERR